MTERRMAPRGLTILSWVSTGKMLPVGRRRHRRWRKARLVERAAGRTERTSARAGKCRTKTMGRLSIAAALPSRSVTSRRCSRCKSGRTFDAHFF